MIITMEELSLVEKAKTVQVHFTLGRESLKAPKNIRGWKMHMHGVLHGKLWVKVYGLPKFALGPCGWVFGLGSN